MNYLMMWAAMGIMWFAVISSGEKMGVVAAILVTILATVATLAGLMKRRKE